MLIKLKARDLQFEIEILEKFTILTGESGKGKTIFYNKVLEYSTKKTPIIVESELPVKAVRKDQHAADLKDSDVVYVVDEDCNLMHELDKLKDINAYFILITREEAGNFSAIRRIPVSVCSYMTFENSGKTHRAKQIYNTLNMKYIHPLKQKEAYKIVEMAKQHDCIRKIVVFGSSITNRCRETSDLDLWIDCSEASFDSYGVFTPEADEIIIQVKKITNYNADILFTEQLVGSLVEKDARDGVCIYERAEKN